MQQATFLKMLQQEETRRKAAEEEVRTLRAKLQELDVQQQSKAILRLRAQLERSKEVIHQLQTALEKEKQQNK